MAISAVLMLGTVTSAVATSTKPHEEGEAKLEPSGAAEPQSPQAPRLRSTYADPTGQLKYGAEVADGQGGQGDDRVRQPVARRARRRRHGR